MPTKISAPFRGVRAYALAHKGLTSVTVAIVVIGGYWGYHKATAATVQTRYVLGTVATSTIVASVSESGQVSASDTIDIKPQVSGTITRVAVKEGQYVRAGQVIAAIDSTNALQSLQSAKAQLASDELTYQKSSAQAPIDYQNDQLALTNAQTQLSDDYTTIYNHLTSVYLDLPALDTAANNVIYGNDFDTRGTQDNADLLFSMFNNNNRSVSTLDSFRTSAVSDFKAAHDAYDTGLADYQGTSRSSSTTDIEKLLSLSVTTMTDVTQALQTDLNFLGTASDMSQTYTLRLPNAFSSVQSTTRTNLATANSDLATLLADQKTLTNDKQAITKAQQQLSLDQVGNPNGGNPISLQISADSLAKERQDITNQESDLAKYTIVAPFNGTISAVSVNPGDSASGAVATIISNSQIAKLSLNEVDAAKIKLGDKVTLTFDAIDGLTLTGSVANIDTVGTVSQGVVSYEVDVSFDTQDERVKPGMTVNADIQTGVAQNALVIPASAVKTIGGQSTVMVFNPPVDEALIAASGAQGVVSAIAPTAVPVTTGLSNDTQIQILSGLTGGEQIVTSTRSGSTNTQSAAASATSRTTGAGAARGGIGGGGGLRIGG